MRWLLLLSLFLKSIISFSQTEAKPVIGISDFTSEINSKYTGAVAEKLVQVVTNTKRFVVVDRTSYDKVKKELEFQKSEDFLDSKNTVKQGAALAAEFIIVGHVLKMSVYAMKNSDGSVNGYKASLAFTMKVNDVATGKTTEAQSFQSKVSPLMHSPESAVNEALKNLESEMTDYIMKTFPLKSKIIKLLSEKKGAANMVLIASGKTSGLKIGDKLTVEKIEMIQGKPYPSEIGTMKVAKISGDDFSECEVTEGGKTIFQSMNAGVEITCTQIVN